MEKRNYNTHSSVVAGDQSYAGRRKTQREIAEYFGLRDKQVVKELLKRERRKERKSWGSGILPRPKGDREKMVHQETLWQSRLMRFSGCAWKTNCCGIFCNPQEEVRAKAKYAVIYRHRKEYPILVMCKFFSVSRSGYYSFVKRMNRPKRMLPLPKQFANSKAKWLSYLRLPADVAMAEGK